MIVWLNALHTRVRVLSPVMSVLPDQKEMSFLKAKKSKRRWTEDTTKVTASKAMLESAKIPLTSSVSLSVKPSPFIEWSEEEKVKKIRSFPQDIGLQKGENIQEQ